MFLHLYDKWKMCPLFDLIRLFLLTKSQTVTNEACTTTGAGQ